jgi:hypothetical protein
LRDVRDGNNKARSSAPALQGFFFVKHLLEERERSEQSFNSDKYSNEFQIPYRGIFVNHSSFL